MESPRMTDPLSVVRRDAESHRMERPAKWPATFWVILKVLCLYHHRRVVTRRLCFQCHVHENLENRCAGNSDRIRLENLDWLAMEYESSNTRSGGSSTGERTPLVGRERARSENDCEVCETLWWNANGVPEKYTESDIGAGWCSHRGSGVLSAFLIIGALSVVLYDVSVSMVVMWAQKKYILGLIIKVTFYAVTAVYPILTLTSKLRSLFTTGVPNLSWASVLNVRYLIRRAQILDIGRKGLPGKHFLIGYFLCASGTSVYRFMMFTYIAGCGYRAPIILTCVFGLIFAEVYASFMYVVYFVRTSFQRQFTLLTYHIKENEGGQLAGCTGTIFAVLEDYGCFRTLCNILAFVFCPVLVFAIAANITTEYSLTDSCVAESPASRDLMSHVAYLSWIEIVMVFSSYVFAVGGLQVEYLLNNFITNLFHLRSDKHTAFWEALLHEMPLFAKESHLFLVTVVLAFMSFFTAFDVSDQDVSDICNATYHELFCKIAE